MKSIKKCQKGTCGYALVEVLLALSIFAIGIIPIYQMIISAAKVQNLAEKTYEATLHSQALLQDIKTQIETDIGEAYRESRKGELPPFGKPWTNGSTIDTSLVKFLGIEPVSADKYFGEKYNLDKYLYEVHIWDMGGRDSMDNIMSFNQDNVIILTACKDSSIVVPILAKENTNDFTNIGIESGFENYFLNKESLVWAGMGEVKPIAIGEVFYKGSGGMGIKAAGIQGDHIVIEDIAGCTPLGNKIRLIYTKPTTRNCNTHELIIEKVGVGEIAGVVALSIDLTTFPVDLNAKTIRIENRTEATIVVPVYNEKGIMDIEIYPIQENDDGRIVVEERGKLEPLRNFVVEIIVRDAKNITFGENNKILSKIVDIYSFDYNKQEVVAE